MSEETRLFARTVSRRAVVRGAMWSAPLALAALAAPSVLAQPLSQVPAGVRPRTALAAASGIYGPDGSHWPQRTPLPDDDFDWSPEVAPTWTAIAAAITTAVQSYPRGKVKIRVKPGTIAAGRGAGSSATGALQAIGATGRTHRILVVPRDGWGTVTAAGSAETSDGYAFVGVAGVTLAGFDFTGKQVLVRNSRDFALAWSTFDVLNITANKGLDAADVELVECVLPNARQAGEEIDKMAFRVADNNSIVGVRMLGCYVAPSYKAAGSSSHTDTLQTSRSSGTGGIKGLAISDSIFFQSSSQMLQFADTSDVALERSAFIGGLRGVDRHPIADGRHVMTAQNTLWGSAANVRLADSLVLGSVTSSWALTSVSGTVVAAPSTTLLPSGFTAAPEYLDRTAPMGAAWYSEFCPLPSRARLAAIWSGLVPGSRPDAPAPTPTATPAPTATPSPTPTPTRLSWRWGR
jgi:hypothetical protein